LRALLGGLLDLCYPRRCEGCGGTVGTEEGFICWDCLMAAQYVTDPMCSRCGDPVDGLVEHSFECGWCCRTRPAFTAARSALRFRGPMREILHRFKYNQGIHLGDNLGALLEGCVRAHFAASRFDGITYVPLHPVKARQRTYNQARLLAESLGRRLHVPVNRHLLERSRFTRTQTRLTAEERKQNVRGAFRVAIPDWVDGRHWLLVDDVMTTGATVDECARVMNACGAASVRVVTVARG